MMPLFVCMYVCMYVVGIFFDVSVYTQRDRSGAIVEHVTGGSRVRIYINKDSSLATFLLAGLLHFAFVLSLFPSFFLHY